METINLGITRGQPPLDVGDPNISHLSSNNFPSQLCGGSHIVKC
jgi:hypothetical protein